MKNTRVLRQAYVSQVDENDCGLACLFTVLRLAGKGAEISNISEQIIVASAGVSLLELKQLAVQANLTANCVRLEIAFLRENKAPSILLTNNNFGRHHFQVCFGSVRRKDGFYYLMADPAATVYEIKEHDLLKIWIRCTALYFSDLKVIRPSIIHSRFYAFLSMNLYPKMLWFAIATLHIAACLLGAGLSWFLQRLISRSNLTGNGNIMFSLVLLLLFVMLFRSLLSFVRQMLLVTLNAKAQNQLMLSFASVVFTRSEKKKQWVNERSIKTAITGIQNILQANVSFLTNIICEGSLVLLILGAIFYLAPDAGLINIVYLVITSTITIIVLPGLQYEQHKLKAVAGESENFLRKEIEASYGRNCSGMDSQFYSCYESNYKVYTKLLESLGFKLNKLGVLNECLGTFSTIGVLFQGLVRMGNQNMLNSTFLVTVIFSYFITSLMQKITTGLFIIAEGAESAKQYQINVSRS